MTSPTPGLTLKHETYYGAIDTDSPDFSGPVPENFTFNTPVGIAQDRHHNLWVCDTGNNRVVIFDRELQSIRRILRFPGTGDPKAEKTPFLMPFHLCPHPEKDIMYLTDMGNARVVALCYDGTDIGCAASFGFRGDGINNATFQPLQDPNGITLVKENSGDYSIYVCDEFYHTKNDSRNRCVRFNEAGRCTQQFKSIVDDDGNRHDLLWPQGIAADSSGRLFIANTGSYEVLMCQAEDKCDKKHGKMHHGSVLLHSFGNPKGIGSFNIMRSVNVIDDLVFVADQVLNTISVYETNGEFKTMISGILPGWNHSELESRTISDYAYYTIEDQVLLNPYTICRGETRGVYFVSEPFTSRVLKIEIPDMVEMQTKASLIASVGGRRNQRKKKSHRSQLNCVTSVIGFNGPAPQTTTDEAQPELPMYARCNPFQKWYTKFSHLAADHYRFWYKMALEPLATPCNSMAPKLTLDAGNWTIKSYSEHQKQFLETPNALEGLYIPGDLAMAVHYPRKPLFGQICPGSPLVFVTNFNFCTITIYQFNFDGKLINYGLPFGFPGSLKGCLLGPQGIAVSPDGEIYIADSLNNRISKWQLRGTGQVFFDSTFTWREPDDEAYSFTPTDIAIDSRNRLFVTDQFNDCIRVFDRDGKDLWSYGYSGYCDDLETDYERFMLPTSLVIDGEELIVNDLVNRALKIFRIEEEDLSYLGGAKAFKQYPQNGGIWMPFFIFAQNRQVYVPDSTFNVVNIFSY